MSPRIHYGISNWLATEKMPLWIIPMEEGTHPQRKFHDHSMSEIVIIRQGPCQHLLNDQQATLETGDVLVVHPGAVHAYDNTAHLSLVNIIYDAHKLCLPILDGYTLPQFQSFFPKHKTLQKHTPKPLLHLNRNELKNINSMIQSLDTELHTTLPGNNLCAMAHFIELIVALCRLAPTPYPTKTVPIQISQAIDFLTRHYDQPISIDDLARSVFMSRRNFFLHFKKITGDSPIRYLIKLRITKAAELLLHTNFSTIEICRFCGFSDSNYFSRKFHEITGVSPTVFRNRESHEDLNR